MLFLCQKSPEIGGQFHKKFGVFYAAATQVMLIMAQITLKKVL
jgi:hypothetical protein